MEGVRDEEGYDEEGYFVEGNERDLEGPEEDEEEGEYEGEYDEGTEQRIFQAELLESKRKRN